MMAEASLFPQSYEDSRARFRSRLGQVQARWPEARLVSRGVGAADEDLTIDWIEAGARQTPERVLLFTLGEHGIEGFVGAAMLELFIGEFLPELDPATTGIRLVHALNPWGMKHRRRTNAANVDLNRNFVWNEQELNPAVNPGYGRADRFLNPQSPPGSLARFGLGLVSALAGLGLGQFRQAVLLGQYEFPEGIYFGGRTIQPESQVLMDLYRQSAAGYGQTLLLDMHTGYGPRYRMSLVNSVHEPRSSAQLQSAFAYPAVVKSDPSEFYAIQGDMIDFVYTLFHKEAPAKRLYATSFEFGTFDDSIAAQMRSLRAMILENQLRRFGTADERRRAAVLREFGEMFFPQESAWQTQAQENARAAFRGILRAEGYIA